MKFDFRITALVAFSLTALAPVAMAAESTEAVKIKAAATQEAKTEWVYEGCAARPVTAQEKQQNMSVASTEKLEATVSSSKTAE